MHLLFRSYPDICLDVRVLMKVEMLPGYLSRFVYGQTLVLTLQMPLQI